MKIGVDYYPEHWDRDMWEKDCDLMAQSGVKIVRMAEFSWSRLEPEEDRFEFGWLDEAVKLFTDRNIQVVLCTPTNCPPLWLYEKYPDAVQTGADGHTIATGIRGHRCYNNSHFLNRCEIIITKLAEHYKDNKNVIAWQIDNELEANFCRCKSCEKKYHSWLKKKYKKLEKLNETYGNAVWSGEYSSWEQVKAPMGSYPHAWLNPAFMLDYNRFASDDMISYLCWQTELIKKVCPNIPVTTNTWFCENMADFYKTFDKLDFVSFDNYPTTKIPSKDSEDIYSHSFHLDLMRGIKQQNFWIMEQLSGPVGSWAPMSPTTQPGMLKGYSMQAIAHGADKVLHFRWRTACKGAEMHWHGIIGHDNTQGRRFREFCELCKTVNELNIPESSVLKSKAAILYSSDNEYAFKIQPQVDGMYYFEQLKILHNALKHYGVNVDIISENSDLSQYEIVCAPTMYVTNSALADRLTEFVNEGGTLLLTNRSGAKDEHNNCIMSPLPAVFRKVAGCYAEEYNPIGYSTGKVVSTKGKEYTCTQWCDILSCENALATHMYSDNFYAGKPCVTENSFGKGKCFYIGTVLNRDFYYDLFKEILSESSLEWFDKLPDNIEVTCRETDDTKYYFVFNNTNEEVSLSFKGKNITLSPFDMDIIEYKK